MKKYGIGLMFLLLLLFMAACGDSGSTSDEGTSNAEAEQADRDEQEQTDDQTANSEKPSVEIKDKHFEKFSQYGDGSPDTVGVYAELKNTGDIPASVNNAEVILYDEEDNVLSTDDAQDTLTEGSLIAPNIMDAGNSGYIAFDIDYEEKFDDLDHVEIEYEPFPVEKSDVIKLKSEKVNVMGEKDDLDESFEKRDDFDEHPLSKADITFNLENEHDENYDYEVGIGLYDKDDNLLATMIDMDYTDVDYTVEAKGGKNVEVKETLPIDIDKVDHAKVYATGAIPDEDEDW